MRRHLRVLSIALLTAWALLAGVSGSMAVQPGEMLADPDPKKSKAVMEAMLKMTKIDIATLERAYRNA